MSTVAIYSGIFCSAEEIAQRVAKKLGYAVVDEGLMAQAAKRFGTTAEKLTRAMAGERGFFNRLTHQWEKSVVYLKAALGEMLQTDDQVYHGPAMHLVPREISHVLRVGLIAARDYRVGQAQEQSNLGAKEAEKRIEKNDEELGQWTQLLFSKGPWDASLYDLKIPVHTMSQDDAVDLICENIVKEALKPTVQSLDAVLDFQLATRVNVSLVEAGHPNCNVLAEQGNVTVVVNRSALPAGQLARTVRSLRLEKAEEEISKLTKELEGVKTVEVVPGAGYGRPAKTLLVDDEREYVVTLSERLDVRDIASNVVLDGQQALSFVETDEPDVMVLDLKMPGMHGLEVLKRMKQEHPQVEVIIVTGHGSEKDEQIARDLGAFDFLHKPVDINELTEMIKAATKKAQSARQTATVQSAAKDN